MAIPTYNPYFNWLRGFHFKRYLLTGKKDRFCRLIKFLLCLILFSIFSVLETGISEHTSLAASTSTLKIDEGAEWHYFKGTQKPPYGWNSSGFNVSSWQKGPSGFGYGKGTNRTYLGDMKGKYLTVYARREFTADYQGISSMSLYVSCDGPFVAYLNGIEVIRNSAGLGGISDQSPERLDITGFAHELFPGINVLSVECSNDDINSDDFTFIPFFDLTEK